MFYLHFRKHLRTGIDLITIYSSVERSNIFLKYAHNIKEFEIEKKRKMTSEDDIEE